LPEKRRFRGGILARMSASAFE